MRLRSRRCTRVDGATSEISKATRVGASQQKYIFIRCEVIEQADYQMHESLSFQNPQAPCHPFNKSSPHHSHLASSSPQLLEGHQLLRLRNRLCRVQTLRACPRAIKNCVASINTHRVVQSTLALSMMLVSRISEPSV